MNENKTNENKTNENTNNITREEYFKKYAQKQNPTGSMTSQEYRRYIGVKSESYSKYGNKKVEYNGIKFDSKKEARRYIQLLALEKNGDIKNLVTQPKFLLLENIKFNGKTLSKRSYNADFQYEIEDKIYVEDVKSKGTVTDVYKLKRHLFLQKYPHLIFREIF